MMRTDAIAREARLSQAVEAIRSSRMTRLQAAAAYGLPESTIRSRLHGSQPRGWKRQRLSPVEELRVAEWMRDEMAAGRVRPSPAACRAFALRILRARGDNADLGSNWMRHFLRRHPGLNHPYHTILPKKTAENENENSNKSETKGFEVQVMVPRQTAPATTAAYCENAFRPRSPEEEEEEEEKEDEGEEEEDEEEEEPGDMPMFVPAQSAEVYKLAVEMGLDTRDGPLRQFLRLCGRALDDRNATIAALKYENACLAAQITRRIAAEPVGAPVAM